jgi:phosphatidylglycerol---prolipoprotein diacylglyceryl transferase
MMNSAFFIGVDPVIVHLGPITIGWYGLMVALAVVTVVGWLAWQNSQDHRLSYDTIFTAAVIGIPSGIIFSKLLHVIDQFGYYSQNPGRILSGEGLTIWGAVLGVALGVWIYSRISKNFRFGILADMIAPGIILAQAIGRVGCTLNGCCYGLPTSLPVGIVYTSPYSYGPIGFEVLPTQVFEIFYNLIVFGILLSLRGKLKPEGSLFTVYLSFYAAWRLGIDFVREGTPFLFGLHQAQFIGVVILAITIPVIIMRVRWNREEKPVPVNAEA